jgi:hypothetical protein
VFTAGLLVLGADVDYENGRVNRHQSLLSPTGLNWSIAVEAPGSRARRPYQRGRESAKTGFLGDAAALLGLLVGSLSVSLSLGREGSEPLSGAAGGL